MYQVLTLLKNKGYTKITFDQLDQFMKNMGNQQFSYDVFKSIYDSEPKIKSVVTDFDKNSISFKTSELDDLKTGSSKNKNTVKQMAKRAVDI